MRLKHVVLFFLLLFLLHVFQTQGKRGGGGRRGGSVSKRLSLWTRRSKSKDKSSPNQRPVGWNTQDPVPAGSVGVKSGVEGGNKAAPPPPGWKIDNKPINTQNKPPPYSPVDPNQKNIQPNNNAVRQAPPAYPGNPPPPYPGNSHHGFSGNPPAYPGNSQSYPSGYGQSYGYGHGANGGQNPYNPQQPFPGYYPTSNIGVIPPRGADHGHYYNSVSGLGGQTHLIGNHQSGGIFGSLFGGRSSYGYGHPGYGGYGYPVKKSGFFSGNAFRNVIAGMFIWHLVSGLTSRPYRVYSYYNQPDHREEINLPPNLITMCNENATALCAPATVPLCTTNNTILCVTTMNAATTCVDGQGLCVNSTISCVDKTDPLCQNITTTDNTTTVNLPCFTNMTIEGDFAGVRSTISIPESEGNKYCVTTMAVPDESIADNANYTITKEVINNSSPEMNNATVNITESTTSSSST